MGKKIIGIEFGSTRIKAVMIDENTNVLAEGGYEWENRFVDGFWTYSLDEIIKGLQESYRTLNEDYKNKFSEDIIAVDALGISAMMHGYLAFDKDDNLLVPFRTWRNTKTEQAADELSKTFEFNIPQRWSVAHFYQAVLSREEHVKDIESLTTLAGFVHYKLTGKRVVGVGDASGIFPVNNNKYNPKMLADFNELIKKCGVNKKFESLLPGILQAGENAGVLTEEGAKLLDPSGVLKPGALMCPPEGDAETGMVATNSIAPKTANVSAGTSGFLMAVLDKPLKNYYKEIDVVATPDGYPVAMVHVNNFTCEINAWTSVFKEVAELVGVKCETKDLIEKLFKKSLESDVDTGKIVGYNFLSGEHIVEIDDGRPTFLRHPEGTLNLANFMQMQIYSALGSLSIGMDILRKEDVKLDSVCGHGGFFKTEFVGQNAMSAALGAPITVMENAGEGGAWGIALLALFADSDKKTLSEFLNDIFKSANKVCVEADEAEKEKFANYMRMYKKGLVLMQENDSKKYF